MKRVINLPYELNALEPTISRETLDFHYNKHHKGYDEKLQKLVEGTKDEKKTLESLIKTTSGKVFNNAAQVWNHNFYWQCLSPVYTNISKKMLEEINRAFKSEDEFKKQILDMGEAHFGSGYVWLVKDGKKLKLMHTSNSNNPLTKDLKPLLTIDLWEHAYYLDYKNERRKYLEEVYKLINWKFVCENL